VATGVLYDAPLGPLYIESEGDAIVEILFYPDERPKFKREIITTTDTDVLRACVEELNAYFAGQLQKFSVPLKPAGTDFRMRVWKALCDIPYGETISYKELAEAISNPKAIRAVGGANHHNPISIIIPCHRVIGANGTLVGYGGGLDKKKFLLGLEQQYK